MNDLQKSKIRSYQYWYVDGVSEIGTGLVVSLIGCFNLLMLMLPNSTLNGWIFALGQPIVILGLFFLSGRLVKHFKEQVTYPRTGFVSYIRRKGNERVKRGVMVAAVAAGISIMVTLFSESMDKRLTPLFVSALLCMALVIFAVNYGVKRFYLIGAYILALGAAFVFLRLPEEQNYGWLFVLFGLGWIFSGAITLIHYMRTTQPADAEELE